VVAESSRRGERGRKSDERITRYSAKNLEKVGPGKTDWKRVDSLTDTQIEAAMRGDPDWADSIDIDWSDAVLIGPTKKTAVSIRLDEDVVNFFKRQGGRYQTRINAVLRHYMAKTKKPDAAE
jgi:uncharacterized protein (DUF4415 family)